MKRKKERLIKHEQEYFQIFELKEKSGLSESKIKTAIYNGELKSCQTCERGVHLVHRDDFKKWLDGRKE